jgi:hypothetical protein
MNNSYDRDESSENRVPQFKSDAEYFKWAFEQISDAIKNLASRQQILEQAIQKMPPPGADMVKYKIPGNEDYSNLKELLDNIYERLNTIESVIGI